MRAVKIVAGVFVICVGFVGYVKSIFSALRGKNVDVKDEEKPNPIKPDKEVKEPNDVKDEVVNYKKNISFLYKNETIKNYNTSQNKTKIKGLFINGVRVKGITPQTIILKIFETLYNKEYGIDVEELLSYEHQPGRMTNPIVYKEIPFSKKTYTSTEICGTQFFTLDVPDSQALRKCIKVIEAFNKLDESLMDKWKFKFIVHLEK